MDTQPDRTPDREAQAIPQTPARQHCTPSAGTDGERYRLAGRSRISPPPWWLTREPTRWDQARLHLTCAALHARESTRELYRAGYAIAWGDRWTARRCVAVATLAAGIAMLILASGCHTDPSYRPRLKRPMPMLLRVPVANGSSDSSNVASDW